MTHPIALDLADAARVARLFDLTPEPRRTPEDLARWAVGTAIPDTGMREWVTARIVAVVNGERRISQ